MRAPILAFPPITLLSRGRIAIRPVDSDDLPDLLEVNGDPEVTRFLPYETWRTKADATAWLERMHKLAQAGKGQQLALVHTMRARTIGSVLLFNFDEPSARIELGYVLGRAWWGHGYMREALALVCDHVFASVNLRRIEAEVNPRNVASRGLLQALGFVLEGTLRERWCAKGVVYDTEIYGCLARDWQRAKLPLRP